MGGLWAKAIKRPMRKWNIENRVNKVISEDKPKPAPRYPERMPPSSADATAENPASTELLERLKNVYVSSEDPSVDYQKKASDASRPLPQMRHFVEESEYGFYEPETVTKGYITLRKAQEMLLKHQQDPSTWNSSLLAKEYDLNLGVTQQIIKHFKTFEVFEPEKSEETSKNFLKSSKEKKLLETESSASPQTQKAD